MRRVELAAGLLLVLSAVACGADDPAAPPPPDEMTPPDRPAAAAASISIDPATVSFGAIGSLVRLSADVRDANGSKLDSVPVTWSVVGNRVVRVDRAGAVVSAGNGVDTVKARVDSVVGVAVVRVSQIPVAVRIAPHGTELTVIGDALALAASVVDSNGVPLMGGESVSWTSSNPAALFVDTLGTVIAVAPGSAIITAAIGTRRDSTTITATVSGPVGGPLTGQRVVCTAGTSGPFACDGIDLLSYLPIAAIGGGSGVAVNDLWGWTDPANGAEYALVGRTDGTAFVDVSDPLRPVYVGFLPRTAGSPESSWRDLKVFADHVFVVADGAGAHGMQVFDLRQLRTFTGVPQTFAPTTLYSGVASVHNIGINVQSGFAFAVGSNGGGQTCSGGLHMIDLRTPDQPSFAGCFTDPQTGITSAGYTHDLQCVDYQGPDVVYQGREMCFGLNENALSIADVTDKASPIAVSRASYPGVSYAHQGWLTEDHQYFFSDDELDEITGAALRSRTIIWDVADLDDPIVVGEYLGPTSATDHNLYISGSKIYASNYQFGIRIIDIVVPTQPTELGFFDTAPTSPNVAGFGGSWSNYPFFASGIIVVTSGSEGLFVLKLSN